MKTSYDTESLEEKVFSFFSQDRYIPIFQTRLKKDGFSYDIYDYRFDLHDENLFSNIKKSLPEKSYIYSVEFKQYNVELKLSEKDNTYLFVRAISSEVFLDSEIAALENSLEVDNHLLYKNRKVLEVLKNPETYLLISIVNDNLRDLDKQALSEKMRLMNDNPVHGVIYESWVNSCSNTIKNLEISADAKRIKLKELKERKSE